MPLRLLFALSSSGCPPAQLGIRFGWVAQNGGTASRAALSCIALTPPGVGHLSTARPVQIAPPRQCAPSPGDTACGHCTGSVLPVIIAHALGNMPFRGWVQPTLLGVLVLVVALWAGPTYRYGIRLWREVMVRKEMTAAGAGCIAPAVVLALITLAPALLPSFGALALGAALMLESREKRSNRALQPTGVARG